MRTKKFTLLMVLVAAVLFAIPAQAFLWNWAEQETPSYFGQKENLHPEGLLIGNGQLGQRSDVKTMKPGVKPSMKLVQVRRAAKAPSNPNNVTITLTAGDFWIDGSGYQMLLDADATAYGTIIPATGPLTSSGDASDDVYAEFEYKIPTNADGSLTTSNIVKDNSVTIEIPAGTYDYAITNPSPNSKMWIASNVGSVGGRADDFVFEAGHDYEFTLSLYGNGDGVDLSIDGKKITTKSTDLVELPTGAAVEDWYAEGISSKAIPEKMKVAFVGSDVYVGGLFTAFPDAWIKGTISGTTVTFDSFQYIGETSTNYVWAVGADMDGVLQDTFTMTYDATAKTLTLDPDQYLLANVSETEAYNVGYYSDLIIMKDEPQPLQIDELPYSNDFSTFTKWWEFRVINANNDNVTWNWYNSDMARIAWASSNDDWLASPLIKLEAGKVYTVSFQAHCQSSYAETIEVKAAKEVSAAALAAGVEVLAETAVSSTQFESFGNDAFTVAESGYYCIGIHNVSNDAYYCYVDDFEVKLKEPEDIEISPESGADIATALATAEEGKNVRNITINLAEGGTYTISASIVAPGNVTINGNGSTINVSEDHKKQFIVLNGTDAVVTWEEVNTETGETVTKTNKDHKFIENVTISDVTITGLQEAIIRDEQKTLLKNFTIENSVIQIPNKVAVNFQSKGYIETLKVNNSTIWSTNNAQFFAQYGSRPKNINSAWLQTFDVQNSTFSHVAYGKNYTNISQNGQTTNVYTLKNNIFVDGGKSAAEMVVGWNNGSKSANPQWTVEDNVFNYNGADASAASAVKAGQKAGEDIVKNSIEGVVTFTDAANGDFNGEIAITWGKDIPAALPGDPRWTLTSSQAPAVPDGNYVVANLSFDPLKYLASGKVSKYGTTFTTAYDKATKTTTLKAGDQYLQEDLTMGATAFAWTVDEDATYGNNIYKMDGETKKFIGVDDETNNLIFVEDAANATIAWGFFYPEYFYAMMAPREVTGPLAGTMKLNEGTGLWEYTAKKVLMTDATSINVQVVINGEADKTYPEEAKVVTLADMGEGATAGCYAITITYNDEGNVVTVNGTKLEAEDIIVEPADISAVDGDIAAAVEAKTDGKLVKSLTINLGENFEYTISNTILTDGSVIINGNGSKIDASELDAPFIQMSTTPSVDGVVVENVTAYPIDGVIIQDVTIMGVKKQLFYANKMQYLLQNLSLVNSVVSLAGTKTIFDFNSGGNVVELLVDRSTIYGPKNGWSNGGFHSTQSSKSVQQLGGEYEKTTITNSTLYNIACGKTVSTIVKNSQTWMSYEVKNNVIVNCGKSGQFCAGLNAGQSGKADGWTVDGNVFNFDGADVSATENTKIAGEITNSHAGVIEFTDAANGDFNGTFLAAPVEESTSDRVSRRDAEEATLLNCGDPRWTILWQQGYAINIDAKFGNVTTAPANYAAEGKVVTITAKPKSADKFELLTLKVEGVTSDIEVEVTPDAETPGKFTFTMPADAVIITATFQRIPEDIIVNPEDITGGDIAAALDAKIAALEYTDPDTGEKDPGCIRNIFINLAPGESYTLTKTLTAPNSISLLGAAEAGDELATINVAEGMTGDVITLDGTEVFATKADGTATDHKSITLVSIAGLAIYDLQGAVVKDAQKTKLEGLSIYNSIIQMPDAGKNVIDFNGKGYVANVVVLNSTIYAEKKNTGFFAQYGSRPKNIDGNDTSLKQTFNVQNSTFANIANGKNFCNFNQKGTTQNEYTIKNNIFTDCGKSSGQVVVGFNAGQTSPTPVWNVDGNIFNWQKNDSSADEISKAGKKDDEDIVKNSLTCRVLFSDVEKPDFGGILVLAPGTEAPETLPGDPRWLLSALDGYTITVQTSNGHGTASAQYPYAIEGEEVGLTIKPEEGYVIESIVMLDADGYVIGLVTGDTFTMPGQDVIIYVGFKNTATGIDAIENDADFEEGEWYTINGVRVDQPTKKGLYIHNGRKVVIK